MARSVLLGRSVLHRPTRLTYVSLVPLVCLSHRSSAVEAYLIFGIDFGPRHPSNKDHDEVEGDHALVPRSCR